jgi:hypothetical protein
MRRETVLLTGLILILMLLVTSSAIGLFYRTADPRIEYVTVRGQEATFQGSGLYRYDPAEFVVEGLVWDAVNLFVGVPLLALGIFLSRRNSLRGRLLLSGLLFYFFYAYLGYAMMLALNPLFLVYIAIFALCGIAFFLNLFSINVARLPEQIGPRLPHRLFAGYMLVMSVALVVLWTRLILSVLASGQFPPEAAGLATLGSQALDLGMLVPLALSAAILLWQRFPWGYLLTAVGTDVGMLMLINIPLWIAVPQLRDGTIRIVQALPIAVVCVVGPLLAAIFYRSVGETNEKMADGQRESGMPIRVPSAR